MEGQAEMAMRHRWEVAGLGLAPFKFLGAENTNHGIDAFGCPTRILGTDKDGIVHSTTPGGTCEFCGQCIFVLMKFRSADGREFHVGQDCALKSGDAGIVKATSRAVKAAQAAKRLAKADAVRAELDARLASESVRAVLSALPHPRPNCSLTLLDWAEWMRDHAGAAGRARALKTIRAAGGAA